MVMHFLVCIDGSESSTRAFEDVIRLIKPEDVCNFIFVSDPIPFDMPGFKEAEAKAQELGNKLVGPLIAKAKENGIMSSKLVLRHGDPRHAILEEVEKFNYDYVTLGSRGLSALKRMVMGSVSDYVIRHSPVSVIVVK